MKEIISLEKNMKTEKEISRPNPSESNKNHQNPNPSLPENSSFEGRDDQIKETELVLTTEPQIQNQSSKQKKSPALNKKKNRILKHNNKYQYFHEEKKNYSETETADYNDSSRKTIPNQKIYRNNTNSKNDFYNNTIHNPKAGTKKKLKMSSFLDDFYGPGYESKITKLRKYLNIFGTFLILFGFILYYFSLKRCPSQFTKSECIDMILQNGFYFDIIIRSFCSAMITSLVASFIFFKVFRLYQIFFIILQILIMFLLDHENSLYKHGLINIITWIVSFIIQTLFFIILGFIYKNLVKKKYLITIFFFFHFFCY